jgi:hypothetical protein
MRWACLPSDRTGRKGRCYIHNTVISFVHVAPALARGAHARGTRVLPPAVPTPSLTLKFPLHLPTSMSIAYKFDLINIF